MMEEKCPTTPEKVLLELEARAAKNNYCLSDLLCGWQSINGYRLRIYAKDGGANYPLHGALFIGGEWLPMAWRSNGKTSIHDLPGEFDIKRFKFPAPVSGNNAVPQPAAGGVQ